MKKIKITKKILIILGVLVIVIGIIVTVLVLNNKSTIKYENTNKITTKNDTNKETQENTETNNNQTANSTTENSNDLNLDDLSSALHNTIKNENKKAYIVNCTTEQTNADGSPNVIETNIEVSEKTIDTIINKLKEATSVENNVTASWFGCPPKSIEYYISNIDNNTNSIKQNRIFSLGYANEEGILLVGYEDKGYAYHYNSNEEINNFIESLN